MGAYKQLAHEAPLIINTEAAKDDDDDEADHQEFKKIKFRARGNGKPRKGTLRAHSPRLQFC